MSRFIDTQKIRFSGQTFDDGIGDKLVLLDDVRMAIEQTPTEEVAPVVHAHWFSDKKQRGCYICSHCKKFAHSDCMMWLLSYYCPSCGARMDGEDK